MFGGTSLLWENQGAAECSGSRTGKPVDEDTEARGPQSTPNSTGSAKADPRRLFKEGSLEMTQLVRAMAAKPYYLSSVPRSLKLEERTNP